MTDEQLRETIKTLVEENPGLDTAYLVEATDTTTRKVNSAIRAIRADVGLDSPLCVVTVKGKHFMPPALTEQGYRLEPNKRGDALLAKAPKEAAKSAESKLAEFKAIIGDRHDHEQVLTLVWERYMAKLEAEEKYKDTVRETRTDIAAATAQFKEVVEEGRENDAESAVNKLHAVEMAWQASEERKSESIERRKEALEEKKRRDSSFLGLIENLNQLEIVFGE